MKLILFAICLMPWLGNAQDTVTNTSLSVSLTLGKGADCSNGRGACSFNVREVDAKSTFGSHQVIPLSETQFNLILKTHLIQNQDQEKIVGSTFQKIDKTVSHYFIMDEPLVLDPETIKLLELKGNILAEGSYPMTIEKDQVSIVFTVK